MAARRVALVTDKVSVPLPSFKFTGMPVGLIVADTTGANWQLSASTSTVDGTTVEAVAGNPNLRWLAYSGGGGGSSAIGDLTPAALAAGFVGAAAAGVWSPKTAAETRTILGVQDSSAVAITGGTIQGATITLALGQLADGPVSVTGASGVLNNPALTGLTATATTLKNDFSTGKSGGLTVVGDTLTTGHLTLRSNNSGVTLGQIRAFGGQWSVADLTGYMLVGAVGAAAIAPLEIKVVTSTAIALSAATSQYIIKSGTGALGFATAAAGQSLLFYPGNTTYAMAMSNTAGTIQVGFFGGTPVAQQTVGAVTYTIVDYATDAAQIKTHLGQFATTFRNLSLGA